jgi:hypothetical protein
MKVIVNPYLLRGNPQTPKMSNPKPCKFHILQTISLWFEGIQNFKLFIVLVAMQKLVN